MNLVLGKSFDENSPLFIQIKNRIEAQIMKGILKEDKQIPSTTQIVQFYKINHITVSKGINLLVDEGIIYKKRGVGMFVSKGARVKLKSRRKSAFIKNFIEPLINETQNLDIKNDELIEIIEELLFTTNINPSNQTQKL